MDALARMNHDLQALRQTLEASAGLLPQVLEAGQAIKTSLDKGGKLLTCGNGGSAADALHLAEELMGRYDRERPPMPALCLCADVAALTCIANDYSYAEVFARQVQGIGRPGDVLVGFTTSGNSPNVRRALEQARAQGITTVLASGPTGGKCRGLADIALLVPSQTTARIQEVHGFILHQWLEFIEA